MTKLSPDFLRAIVLLGDFKQGETRKVKAALLAMAMTADSFTAADLPGEICNGDIHLAGACCGSLLTQGLIESVGRVKSPDPQAKGRKLNLYRLAAGKFNTVRAWFNSQGITPPPAMQTEIVCRAQPIFSDSCIDFGDKEVRTCGMGRQIID